MCQPNADATYCVLYLSVCFSCTRYLSGSLSYMLLNFISAYLWLILALVMEVLISFTTLKILKTCIQSLFHISLFVFIYLKFVSSGWQS